MAIDEHTYLVEEPEDPEQAENPQPVVPVEPPRSRFLFVDVAAMRAKQLRRGAHPRLGAEEGHQPLKAERIAMEEVGRGLVAYDLPEWRPHAQSE
jgi:DNA-directed RNA polymerase subunit K/omega